MAATKAIRTRAPVGTDTKLAQRVASIESSIDAMIERMGERIELAIERALKNYTHRDDHSGLEERVKELEAWKIAHAAGVAVENKHSDQRRASLDEWGRTLFPYAVMLCGIAFGLKGLMQ